jgi:hypothetical protein
MTSKEEIDGLLELLAIHRKRITIYLKQIHYIGILNASPSLFLALEIEQAEVKRIKEVLLTCLETWVKDLEIDTWKPFLHASMLVSESGSSTPRKPEPKSTTNSGASSIWPDDAEGFLLGLGFAQLVKSGGDALSKAGQNIWKR